jgi:hypothetical protein
MIPVGTEVRHRERVGKIDETASEGNGGGRAYSRIRFGDNDTLYVYDDEIEILNSTRSKIAMKLNTSGNPKEYIVIATYPNPAQGVKEQKGFDSDAQAKDFAARSVVEANKGAEAYVYRLERVARLPLPDVDWQGNTKA